MNAVDLLLTMLTVNSCACGPSDYEKSTSEITSYQQRLFASCVDLLQKIHFCVSIEAVRINVVMDSNNMVLGIKRKECFLFWSAKWDCHIVLKRCSVD